MRPVDAPLALAARRAMITAMALAVTLAAHVMAVGHGPGPAFLVVSGTIVLAALMIGPRRRAFAPRGFGTTFALLVAAQAVAHLAMSAAPWAFGLAVHADAAVVTLSALIFHVVAALLLTLVVFHLERLVAAVLAAARAVRALWRPPTRATPPPQRADAFCTRAARPLALGPSAARAPPLAA